jgi:hypothetical protein
VYLSEQSLAVKSPEIKKILDIKRPALHRQAINDTIERLSVVDGFN